MEVSLAKVLPFARPAEADEPRLDVSLVKGDQRRRYVVAPVGESAWESRVATGADTERRVLSRAGARRRKAQFELEIATRLSAGWIAE
jgi:chorismate mutase